MKFTVLTLFPEFVNSISSYSIIKRAIAEKKLQLDLVNIRDFSEDKYKTVDDKPYGGGPGMVLKVDVVERALASVKKNKGEKIHTILLDPRGKKFTQTRAAKFSQLDHLIIVCGHYEAVDERIKYFIDEQISVGDFILTGGEIPALALIDSVGRLIKGVINEESLKDESVPPFLFEYPHYTRPEIYKGHKVPPVLLSGNHEKIETWKNSSWKKIKG